MNRNLFQFLFMLQIVFWLVLEEYKMQIPIFSYGAYTIVIVLLRRNYLGIRPLLWGDRWVDFKRYFSDP